jgi:hypothetical protein
VVVYDAGCAHLDLREMRHIVPVRAFSDFEDVAGPSEPASANCPSALGIQLEKVLAVFPAGPSVVLEGRSWIREVLRAARDAEAECRSG